MSSLLNEVNTTVSDPVEEQRMRWTTFTLNTWIDYWEEDLVNLGFGTGDLATVL